MDFVVLYLPLVPPSPKSPLSLLLPLPLPPLPMPSSYSAPSPLYTLQLLRWVHLAAWIHLVLSGLQLHPSVDPLVHLKPLSPGLHLGLSTHLLPLGSTFPQLHCGPPSLRLHRASPSLWLPLGQSSPWFCHGHPVLRICLIASPWKSSNRLFFPSSSTIVLAPSGFASVCRAPVSTSTLSVCPLFPLFLLLLIWLS